MKSITGRTVGTVGGAHHHRIGADPRRPPLRRSRSGPSAGATSTAHRSPGQLWRPEVRGNPRREERGQDEGAGIPGLAARQRNADAEARHAAARRRSSPRRRASLASVVKDFGLLDLPFIVANFDQGEALISGPFGKSLIEKLPEKDSGRPRLLDARLPQRHQQSSARSPDSKTSRG